jgi:hypothetical protein
MLKAGVGDEPESTSEGGMMARTEKEKMLAGELYNGLTNLWSLEYRRL